LKVTGDGTPRPRPSGGASAPGASTPAGAKDEQAPTVSVKILSRLMRVTRADGVLKVRVKVDEASTVTLQAAARPRPGGPLVTVATAKQAFPGAGSRNVEALLTKAGRSALRGRRPLAIVVSAKAVDAAGNSGDATHGRTLGLR
jgi:hypothetical protein